MRIYIVMSPYEHERMNPFIIEAISSGEAMKKCRPLAYEIKNVTKKMASHLRYSVGIFEGYETTNQGYKKIKIKNNRRWYYEVTELF